MRSGLFLILCLCAVPSVAFAQETDGDLRLMHEPTSWVDIPDAFDGEDPFDVYASLRYIHRREWGTIQREPGTRAPMGDPNRLSQNWQDVASHEWVQNVLEIGLDIGIFRDLAVFGRMPIIMSDDRSFSLVNGVGSGSPLVTAADTIDDNGDGTDDLDAARPQPFPLFQLDSDDDFRAPTRSGLDYIEAGLEWSIFNQHREPGLPTWALYLSGLFNVGEPLRACRAAPGGPACRNWSHDEATDAWSFVDTEQNAGMTRGTNALHVETRASWRTRYVEPYAGLDFLIEWPDFAGISFLPAGDLQGFINEQPPIRGAITGGMSIIPWEDRASFQRIAVDVRFTGRYISEGHGYSPLFDALGTSQNRYFTFPNLEGNQSAAPGADLRTVPFVGLTDTQSHAEFGATVGIELWAARYVRFNLNSTLTYIAPYLITYADACNPNVNDDEIPAMDPRRGTCRRGIINPHHRPVIDLPGQRFRMGEQIRLEIDAKITGTF